MIPFLKTRQEASAMGDEDSATKRRKPDEYDMLDAIVEDFYQAFERKDKSLLRGAIEGLCEYLREEDQEQDELLENKE